MVTLALPQHVLDRNERRPTTRPATASRRRGGPPEVVENATPELATPSDFETERMAARDPDGY